MQRTEYRPESPWHAFLSVPILLAIISMVAFYFSVAVPDKAALNASATGKPGENTREVIKEAKKLKAYRLMEKGQLMAAVEASSKMLSSNPQDVASNYCAALILMKSGRKDDAFLLMKKALAIVPRNKDLRLEYARMLAESGNTDDAIIQYRLVISQSPTLGPRMDLAQLYLSTDRPGEAAKELQELLKLAPNNVAAHKICGIALARSGKAQEGMEEYLRGTISESGAGQPEAVKFILGSWGNIDKAKFELERQAQRTPDDPMPKLRLAEICLYADRPADAKQYLVEARKLAPSNPEIHRYLCVAHKRLGNNREALTSFMQSVALEIDQNAKLKKKKLGEN